MAGLCWSWWANEKQIAIFPILNDQQMNQPDGVEHQPDGVEHQPDGVGTPYKYSIYKAIDMGWNTSIYN